jgi:formylglycine-generating enzyme required for sulfatase activity
MMMMLGSLKAIALVMLTIVLVGAAVGLGTRTPATARSPAAATSASVPAPAPAGADLVLELGGHVTMKLARIPAGKFVMGSPATEEYRGNDEVQHEVTISRPFYMGITHVTVDQFAAFVAASGYRTDAEKAGASTDNTIANGDIAFAMIRGISWRKPGFAQGGDHPAVQISWNDAMAFCKWLSEKSGQSVTLPTEAQWEYACRAGTQKAYPWGDNPEDGNGWGNYADQHLYVLIPKASGFTFFDWDDGYTFTAPAGHFRANAFELYDMTGNAWQWCLDRFGPYGKAGMDPEGPARGAERVQRGGAWSRGPNLSRVASRRGEVPDSRRGTSGFRVVVNEGR